MKHRELKPEIFWVGAIDWNLRNFHGYETRRGSTYNAYLIVDEKVVLIDTVKEHFFPEMLSRIKSVIDPQKIDYIISGHVEMDHSGSLPAMLKLAPRAKIITSPAGERGLKKHFGELPYQVVKTGDTLNIGKRNLQFVEIPMVHWPDSMVTYSPQDRVLFPNDAFGQHIASFERFDGQMPLNIITEEAAKYYANIVLRYGSQVEKALNAVSSLEIEMIAPSHGIIWKTHIEKILKLYWKWAKYETELRALIAYDTMWGSTEKLAFALYEGLEEAGIPTTLRKLSTTHITDVMTDVLESRLIAIGSPTINQDMLPTVGGFLTYLRGFAPRKRTGFAFGSYGWGKGGPERVEEMFKEMKFNLPVALFKVQYLPTDDDLENMRQVGEKLGTLLQSTSIS